MLMFILRLNSQEKKLMELKFDVYLENPLEVIIGG